MHMLRYTVNMPPRPPIADLATREVTQQLNAETAVRPFPPEAADFTVDAEAGTLVSLSLVDVDTSGNRSDPSAPLSFTATDTVPPPAPGGMAVAKVEQVDTAAKGGPHAAEQKKGK
jgi:hypothetical protein